MVSSHVCELLNMSVRIIRLAVGLRVLSDLFQDCIHCLATFGTRRVVKPFGSVSQGLHLGEAESLGPRAP